MALALVKRMREKSGCAWVSRGLVFKVALVSFYHCQVKNLPELAGRSPEGPSLQPQANSAPLSPPSTTGDRSPANILQPPDDHRHRSYNKKWCCFKPLAFRLLCHIAIANLNTANNKSLKGSKDSSFSKIKWMLKKCRKYMKNFPYYRKLIHYRTLRKQEKERKKEKSNIL